MANQALNVMNKNNDKKSDEFVPRGALAFFALMLLCFGLIWLGMYWLTLHRQLGL